VLGYEWIADCRYGLDMMCDAIICCGPHIASKLSLSLAEHDPNYNYMCFLAARGELNPQLAGRVTSISHLASTLGPEHSSPTVIIETTDRKIVVKDYDSMTIALRCKRIEN
jgi:hypothetical protein